MLQRRAVCVSLHAHKDLLARWPVHSDLI